MNKIVEETKKLPSWILIPVLAIIIIIGIRCSFKFFTNQFVDLFKEAIDPLESAFNKNMDILKTDTFNLELTKLQREILIKKVEVIQDKKEHHLFLTRNLYKNNYTLLSLFPFLSAITGIFVFLIIQNGWKESNLYLKFGFIIFGTLTTLTGIFPDIYQQEQSIDNNLKNYVEYDNLQHEIFFYSLTAPVIRKDTILFNSFLDALNSKEKELNKIYFVLSEEEFKNPFLEKFGGGN